MVNKLINVLLIEDSTFATRHTQKMLDDVKSARFATELKCAARLSEGLEYLVKGGIDIILLDLTLPDSNELETYTKVHTQNPDIPVVVISGIEDETLAMQAVKQGAQDYLVKGRLHSDTLKRSILYALERKKTELQIQMLNRKLTGNLQKLETANKELEAFSYSVSHDLHTPLRAIDGFSQILLDDHARHLSKEGLRVLNVIKDNAKKMGQLIDDLLAFSRLGRKKILKTMTDMAKMVQDVQKELKLEASSRQIRWNLNRLPPAYCDFAMIRQVYANLLSNAVKFTKVQKKAVIGVGYQEKEKEVVYYVKDNGVGFDEKYKDILFNVFQRLHSDTEFGGTGVGLAIVKRIIQKHGGRVWAESKVNKGATFYFSLPAKGDK
jgi:two-component system sensor kinase